MADSKPAAYTAPAAALVASSSDGVRPNAKLIALLSFGHFVVDLNQGALPAVLPFLKSAHQLSYASAATIVLAANVASSLVQPLFGYFADQTARRWMLPASVLLTGTGFALMGLAPGYAALIGLVVMMGLGVAAYHPEAYKTATSVMQWVLLAALPFGVLFLMVDGVRAFVMLGVFGAILTSSFSVSIVLGQAYLPRNSGTATGLILGFAIGAGGLGVTALGWVADRYGLTPALWISALMPLAAFVPARFLPAPRVAEAR